MENGRKSVVALALPLLINLLTLRVGDAYAGRDSDPAGKIILEEVIVAGSGNNTRIIANAVADDPTRIGDDVLALLSKRETRDAARSGQATSYLDQNVEQTRASIVNADNEDDIERLKRVIAKYEPQRIISRKSKRKIVDNPDVTHDIRDADEVVTVSSNPMADFERIYHEVLRNISRNMVVSTADATANPYLSLAMKNLKRVYVPEATIYAVVNGGADKTPQDSTYAAPRPFLKKTTKLPKKYSQSDRASTVTSSWISPSAEAKSGEETADGSTASQEYLQTSRDTIARPKNGSSSPTELRLRSTERPDTRDEWNIRGISSRIAVPSFFASRTNDNDAYNGSHADRPYGGQSNSPGDLNGLRPKYGKVPRPFGLSHPYIANARVENTPPYRKSNLPPTNVKHVQQASRSSGNVLPLILPTELFISPPPVRHYVQIKRADPTATFTGATAPVADARGLVLGQPNAPYANAIATAAPTIVVDDGLRRGAGVVTDDPAGRIVAGTNFAATTAASLAGLASYSPRQQKDPRTVREKDAQLRVAGAYDEKSDTKANDGFALYNRFASLYPANVLDAPRADYRDAEPRPTSRVVTVRPTSALAYSTHTRPASPQLPETRPTIVAVKPLAPYYDGRLFAPLDGERVDGNDEGRTETYEQHRTDDSSETEGVTEKEVVNGGSGRPESDRETRIDQAAYRIHETPKNERLKKERFEDERQRTRDHRDEYRGRHDGNARPGKSRREDETRIDERSSAEDDEDERDRTDRYNNDEYRRDDSEEERQDRKRYNKETREHRNDRVTDARDVAGNYRRHFDVPRYNDRGAAIRDKDYRYDRKEAERDDRYGKNRRDRDGEYEDEGAKDREADRDGWRVQQQRDRENYESRRSRERHERRWDDTPRKRKYDRNPANSPNDRERSEEHKEEYSETNPDHVRQEYQQQRPEADRRGGHDGDKDEVARDQVHGQETKEHAKKHHGGDHKFAKGEGAEHKEEHHGQAGEEGHKGYKVWNEHEKAEKGHHDREHSSKEYDEKEGEQKKHEEEDGYHEEHHRDEEGKKEAEFGEKGEHQKGHSTKGQHSVHKKDEYEKKTEFFDEFHEDGGVEKHGEHHHEHESKKGGHVKKGHHDHADHEEKHGKEEKHEKGGHHHEYKGHKVDEGHNHHYDHDRKHGKKEGHESGKKWSYKKGDGGGGGDHKHDSGHDR